MTREEKLALIEAKGMLIEEKSRLRAAKASGSKWLAQQNQECINELQARINSLTEKEKAEKEGGSK